MNRRRFLLSTLAAPAVITTAGLLMPVRSLLADVVPLPYKGVCPNYVAAMKELSDAGSFASYPGFLGREPHLSIERWREIIARGHA